MIHFISRRRRRLAAVIAILGVLVMAGTAWAYFSGTGSASGNANGGSAPQLVVSIGSINDVYPGEAVDVPITIAGNANHAARAGKIVLTGVSGGVAGECGSAQFSMPDVSVAHTFAAGAAGITYHGSLTLAETGASQDDCVGLPFTVSVAVQP